MSMKSVVIMAQEVQTSANEDIRDKNVTTIAAHILARSQLNSKLGTQIAGVYVTVLHMIIKAATFLQVMVHLVILNCCLSNGIELWGIAIMWEEGQWEYTGRFAR